MVKVKGQSTNSCKSIETAKKPQKILYQQVFKNTKNMQTLNAMERFVESISQGNDSANFDASFEIKNILSPKGFDDAPAKPLLRHRCITELDREKIEQFVRDFEHREYRNNCDKNNNESCAIKTTPKCSPYFYRKAKSIYQNSWIGSRNSSPRSCTPTDQMTSEIVTETVELQRNSFPERLSYRSAAKMLQFFATKKSKSPNKHISSTSDLENAHNSSPILRRYKVTSSDGEADDGLDSQGDSSQHTSNSSESRTASPDSSFEMHPPLMPVFKVTPPPGARLKTNRNPAYEFARFLRGSFHAKRASITTLRTSIGDSQNFANMGSTKSLTGIKAKKPIIKLCTVPSSAPTTPKANVISKAQGNILVDTTTTAPVKHQRQQLQPKAHSFRNHAISTVRANSPFRRPLAHSSFRTTDNESRLGTPLVRRSISMTASDNDVYTKSMETSKNFKDELSKALIQQKVNRAITVKTETKPHKNTTEKKSSSAVDGPRGAAAWTTSFEGLLADPAGLQTFAEFLKKEFSDENIYFWTACERFRQTENDCERAEQAAAIFDKYLSNSAKLPVNVDSQARNLTEEKLTSAKVDIFALAQKQIFNLMKFDSYPRFLRSDLYKSCFEAEQKRQPLPFNGEGLDELLKINLHQNDASKLKKSASNAEDHHRKSLLPWHRKSRSKSRDRTDNDNAPACSNRLANHLINTGIKLPQISSSTSLRIPSFSQNSNSDTHSSRSSLSSFDAMPSSMNGNISDLCSLCRVILNDGATTIVQTRPKETVGQMVARLLEKRGITYTCYNVVTNGKEEPVDLNSLAQSTVAGKEVFIEQRVFFKLRLLNSKVISVKSKPKKLLHEALQSILPQYNYSMEGVQLIFRDTRTPLDLSLPVTAADGQQLQLVLPNDTETTSGSNEVANGANGKFIKPAIPKNVRIPKQIMPILRRTANTSQSTLDEITNKVFKEVLESKVEAHDRAPLVQAQDICSLKSDGVSETSSSIFERLRHRDTNIPVLKYKSKKKSTGSQHSEESSNTQTSCHTTNNNTTTVITKATKTNDVKKPIIAKLKAGVKLQVTKRVPEQQDELLEGLTRAQLSRLEDQRGTEINSELPDFLNTNKNNVSATVAATNLRKLRANLSPINQSLHSDKSATSPNDKLPQPAPRLSITNKLKSPTTEGTPTLPASSLSPDYKNCNIQSNMQVISPIKMDIIENNNELNSSAAQPTISIWECENGTDSGRGPPPLPPKPKVLPMKPSNWSGSSNFNKSPKSSTEQSGIVTSRCAFLEEPSSSFV